jgi:hypothetical protein
MPDLIDLETVQDKISNNRLWAVRGKAVQAYANLEQALCILMGSLSDVHPKVSGIIFFKIVSTGARTSILEKLLHNKFDTKYNLFWNSFVKLLKQVDGIRNEIVHWNAVVTADIKGSVELTLMPPNIFGSNPNTPSHNVDGILEFINKCNYLTRLGSMFNMILFPPKDWSEEDQKIWRDLYQQPIEYPPSNNIPCFNNFSDLDVKPSIFIIKGDN